MLRATRGQLITRTRNFNPRIEQISAEGNATIKLLRYCSIYVAGLLVFQILRDDTVPDTDVPKLELRRVAFVRRHGQDGTVRSASSWRAGPAGLSRPSRIGGPCDGRLLILAGPESSSSLSATATHLGTVRGVR